MSYSTNVTNGKDLNSFNKKKCDFSEYAFFFLFSGKGDINFLSD